MPCSFHGLQVSQMGQPGWEQPPQDQLMHWPEQGWLGVEMIAAYHLLCISEDTTKLSIRGLKIDFKAV